MKPEMVITTHSVIDAVRSPMMGILVHFKCDVCGQQSAQGGYEARPKGKRQKSCLECTTRKYRAQGLRINMKTWELEPIQPEKQP